MGRWTDKPYIAQSEWSNSHGEGGMQFGGKKTNIQGKEEATQELPFGCCALSLTPCASPVCTSDGYVFDADNIYPYIEENRKHPLTGEPLETGDLRELHFLKNANGDHVDPISLKPFTRFTKIVAIRTSGNIYSWDTVNKFNIRADDWNDLVTGQLFSREDIVVLQDPSAPKRPMQGETKENAGTAHSTSVQESAAKAPSPSVVPGSQNAPYNAAGYSKGLAAASFTSTSFAPVTKNESELIDDEEYMFARIKAKGYARIITSLGDINTELYCDKAPRTCYNFIKLARSGYYRGIRFHRSIKNFMIQGGDPTGTGRGGRSVWGKDFEDETVKGKSHSARGVLSMANRGPNTNSSQFFILYRAAPHLDGKHTIFGRVVGGMSVLSEMEAVPTDDDDRPKKDIVIKDVKVFVDPFDEFAKRLEKKLEHQRDSEDLTTGKRQRTEAEELQHERDTTTWLGTKVLSRSAAAKPGPSGYGSSGADTGASSSSAASKSVGKYMRQPRFETAKSSPHPEDSHASKKAAKGYRFGDFSGW
ncbi:cyclophilin-like protein [Martensiomyces pterosporus]|nr:cyclophilin-like protein [Martensiomyces pterosporus]